MCMKKYFPHGVLMHIDINTLKKKEKFETLQIILKL